MKEGVVDLSMSTMGPYKIDKDVGVPSPAVPGENAAMALANSDSAVQRTAMPEALRRSPRKR